MKRLLTRSRVGCALALALLGCGGAGPAPGASAPRLAPCPDRPNCVSSRAADDAHRVAPFVLASRPEDAFADLLSAVRELPRARVVVSSPETGYLRAECRSRILRFVDDLELAVDADRGVVDVRSASRVGYGDLGVNRSRVDALRELLRARGAIR